MGNYNYLFAFLIIYLVGVLVLYFLPRKKQLSETFITVAEAIMFGGMVVGFMCGILLMLILLSLSMRDIWR